MFSFVQSSCRDELCVTSLETLGLFKLLLLLTELFPFFLAGRDDCGSFCVFEDNWSRSRVCAVVHYAVLEAIHAVYGIWQI